MYGSTTFFSLNIILGAVSMLSYIKFINLKMFNYMNMTLLYIYLLVWFLMVYLGCFQFWVITSRTVVKICKNFSNVLYFPTSRIARSLVCTSSACFVKLNWVNILKWLAMLGRGEATVKHLGYSGYRCFIFWCKLTIFIF